MTNIVDVPNEDPLLEALYDPWVLFKTYPTVSPVADASEFGTLMQRVGITG